MCGEDTKILIGKAESYCPSNRTGWRQGPASREHALVATFGRIKGGAKSISDTSAYSCMHCILVFTALSHSGKSMAQTMAKHNLWTKSQEQIHPKRSETAMALRPASIIGSACQRVPQDNVGLQRAKSQGL